MAILLIFEVCILLYLLLLLVLVLCLSICACDYTVQTRAKAQSARVWTIINKNVHTYFCNFFRLNIFGIFLEDQYVLPC